jgi:hypothetical protein
LKSNRKEKAWYGLICPEKRKEDNIPYEFKAGDQVLLETPGILRKLSTPRTGPYPVPNVCKYGTI